MAEDLDDVDAVSFATSVGAAAAAHLYALLELTDYMHFSEDQVRFLASFESSNPETLWLEGQGRGWFERVSWAQLPIGRRLVVSTFAHTAMDVYRGIVTPQKAAAADRERLRQAKAQPGLKREDSIAEEDGPLDELIPGGKDALRAMEGKPPLRAPGAPRTPATRMKSHSIGETGARPPENRGGRGRVKPDRDRKSK